MATWIKFKLIARPYYDPRNGQVLASINGRYNRPKVDPFVGGGYVHPDLKGYGVLKTYQKDGVLYVLVDDSLSSELIEDLVKVTEVEYDASPTTVLIDKDGFLPAEMSIMEAISEISEKLNILPSDISGVTK